MEQFYRLISGYFFWIHIGDILYQDVYYKFFRRYVFKRICSLTCMDVYGDQDAGMAAEIYIHVRSERYYRGRSTQHGNAGKVQIGEPGSPEGEICRESFRVKSSVLYWE